MKRKIMTFWTALFTLAIALYMPKFMFAENTNSIIINEIAAYLPSKNEWIEIFNRGNAEVNIESWKFYENETKHGLKIIQGSNLIKPQEYAIIANNASNFLSDHAEFSQTLLDSSWSSLKENGEKIGLINEKDEFVELFSYPPAEETSLERMDPWSNSISSDHWKPHSNASSPGSQNENYLIKNISLENNVATPDNETEESHPSPSTNPDDLQFIIINEILPNPKEADSEYEWIELKNTSEDEIDLTGLTIDDAEDGSNPYTLKSKIAAQDFIILRRPETKLSLNNNQDSVRLIYDEKILDEVKYKNAPLGKSLIRIDDGVYEWTLEPTPGEENVLVEKEESEEEPETEFQTNVKTTKKSSKSTSKTNKKYRNGDLSDEILINEIFPNPKGSDSKEEWIELFNASDQNINLGNWQIDDDEGGSKPFTLSDQTNIKTKSLLVIPRTLSKISLNNTEDAARLIDFEGNIVDEVEYEEAKENFSYAKISLIDLIDEGKKESWEWTSDTSKGLPNPEYEILTGTIMALNTENNEIPSFILAQGENKISVTFETVKKELAETLFVPETELQITAKKSNEGEYELKKFEILHSPEKKVEENNFKSNALKILMFIFPAGLYFFVKKIRERF